MGAWHRGFPKWHVPKRRWRWGGWQCGGRGLQRGARRDGGRFQHEGRGLDRRGWREVGALEGRVPRCPVDGRPTEERVAPTWVTSA